MYLRRKWEKRELFAVLISGFSGLLGFCVFFEHFSNTLPNITNTLHATVGCELFYTQNHNEMSY